MSAGDTGLEFRVSARREEVGAASGRKAEGDGGAQSGALPRSQEDRRRPIAVRVTRGELWRTHRTKQKFNMIMISNSHTSAAYCRDG